MVDIQSVVTEIRRGKKIERKETDLRLGCPSQLLSCMLAQVFAYVAKWSKFWLWVPLGLRAPYI